MDWLCVHVIADTCILHHTCMHILVRYIQFTDTHTQTHTRICGGSEFMLTVRETLQASRQFAEVEYVVT